MSLYDEAILIQKPSGYKAEKLYNVIPSPEVTEQSSIEFDGVDDELITDGDSVAQPTTYSFWAKASETGGNTGVFGHGGTSIGAFHFNYGSKPLLYLGSGYYRYWVDNSAQDDGEWHHWVVYSDTNDITNSKLYVDGVLQEASTTSTGSTSAYTEGLTIGGDKQSSGNYFNGSISDFAVFSSELNQSDVTEIYNYGSPNDLLEASFVNDLDLYYQMGNGILDSYPLIADQTNATLGSQIVTNGDFEDGSTDWTFQSSWSISGGKANYDAVTTQHYLKQTMSSIDAGKTVKIQFDISDVQAGKNAFLKLEISGTPELVFTYTTFTEGTYTYYHTITSGLDRLNFVPLNTGTGGSFSIDNISVKQVQGNPAAMTNMSSADIVAWTPNIETDFDVARSSTTTRRNASGYIEQVAANVPRLNYDSGDSCPYLLTEAASTNLITYPKSFGNSYWAKVGVSIEGDASTAGSELVTNGTFTGSATGWTLGTGWSYGTNEVDCDGTVGGNLQQNTILTIGNMYLLTFDISTYNSGTLSLPSNRYEEETNYTSADSYSVYIIAKVANLYFYSDSFDGSVDNISCKQVTGFAAPKVDGSGGFEKEAYKLVEGTNTGGHLAHTTSNIAVTGSTDYDLSLLVKADERYKFGLRENHLTGLYATFDLQAGTVLDNSANTTANITALVNGWYRIDYVSESAGVTFRPSLYLLDDSYTTGTPWAATYTGDGTSGIYLAYAQLEEGSYASSLMLPTTEGSTTSRVADAITNAGNQSLFSNVNSNGVLYAEIAALADDGTWRLLGISDGTGANRVVINYNTTSNRIQAEVRVANAIQAALNYTSSDVTQFHKVAVRWKVNDFSLWVDGVEIATDTSGLSYAADVLTTMAFMRGDAAEYFYGKCREVDVYEYLTDAQMVLLTT